MLSATSVLLQLVAGRFDVDSVLEFLALGPVRERFGFDDDNLGVIGEWVEATNVRWGLDPSERERLGLPGSVVTNTWAAAVERLLVGSAVFDEDLRLAIGDVAPYGVEGGDVETIGSLAAVMGCLADLAAEVTTARPLAEWVERIGQTCAALFAAERDQGWQLEALERILGEVLESSVTGEEASSVSLEFGDVWKLLDERLDDKVGRADFFRGGITVTSLTPLRWVPFRVVCLLGMDQSAFGAEGSAGDDLSATGPAARRPGPERGGTRDAVGGRAGRAGPSGGGAGGSRRADQPARPEGGTHHRALRVPAGLGGHRGPGRGGRSPRDRPPPSALRRALLRAGAVGRRHALGVRR